MDLLHYRGLPRTIVFPQWQEFCRITGLLSDDHHRLTFLNPSALAPYHNAGHAAAVAQSAFEMLRHGYLHDETKVSFDIYDIAVVMLAALVHDYAHTTRPDSIKDNIAIAIREGVSQLQPYRHGGDGERPWPMALEQIAALVTATRYTKDGYEPLTKTPPGEWTSEQFAFFAGILRDADIYSALLPQSTDNVLLGLPAEFFQDLTTAERPTLTQFIANNIAFQRNHWPQTTEGAWFFTAHAPAAFQDWLVCVARHEGSVTYKRDPTTLQPTW